MTYQTAVRSPSPHPLSGLEAWPKTGPVYGFAEEETASRKTGFWRRLGDRLRKPSPGEAHSTQQARIWY